MILDFCSVRLLIDRQLWHRFASDQDCGQQWKRNMVDERFIEFVRNYSELYDFSREDTATQFIK